MAVLRILEQREVDFIAMDMQMPTLDGVETTRKICAKEKGAGGHVPIAAMTANAFEEDRHKCMEAGMDGFVVKPVSVQSICEEMDRLLALQEVAAEKSLRDNGIPEFVPAFLWLDPDPEKNMQRI